MNTGILFVFNNRGAKNGLGNTYYQPHGERTVCIFYSGNRSTLLWLAFFRGEAVMSDSIEQAMKNAKASLELSGFKMKEYHTELVRKVMTGEMKNEDRIQACGAGKGR